MSTRDGKRVVIIEDERDDCDLERLLTRIGLVVAGTASNGKRGSRSLVNGLI